MAIRRKRKTLTNVLSQMDSRIRSTELRQLSSGSGLAVEAGTSYATSTSLGTVVSDNAPADFIRILGGQYYSKRVTGGVDKVELYLASDTGVSSRGTITVSGIRSPYSVSGDYAVDKVNPTGVDRPAWLLDLPAGVTSSILFSTGQDIPISAAAELTTKYEIASYEASTTQATITFTAAHNLLVNDYINASDLPSPYPGLDGAYQVSSVPSSTSITYDFVAAIADPINSAVPSTTSYIYAVTQESVSIGDTWIDTSTSPSTTYYWNGIRWSTLQTGAEGGADEIAPADVSNVTSTTSAYTIDSGVPRANVTLSWDAPTTNSDASTLTDLAGYDVWASYTQPDINGDTNWTEKTGLLSADNSTIISGLNQNAEVWFKIFAIDSSLNRSNGVVHSETTSIFALELNAPSIPTFITELSTLTVIWDGKDNTGVNPPTSIRTIEVHVSTTDGFAPDSDPDSGTYTLQSTMVATTGPNYAVVTGLDVFSANPLILETYFIKLVAVDVLGNRSAASIQASTTISQLTGNDIEADSITANQIDAGSISAELIGSGTFIANNVGNTAGIEFNSNVLRAYGPGGDNFVMYSANGVVEIGASTVISGDSITTGSISADRISGGTIDASTISVTNLDASNITTGSISADRISGGTIDASSIVGVSISGVSITGSSLLTTAVGSKSVRILGSAAEFLYSGSVTGTLQSNSGASTYAPKLELTASGTSNNGWSMFMGDTNALFGGIVTTVGIAGLVNIFIPGNTGLAVATVGRGQFQEGIEFDSGQAYTLKIVSGRLESSADFRAAQNMNIGGDLYWSGTIGTGTTYPLYFRNTDKLVYRLSSSARYKTNIADINVDMDKFLSATPRVFQNAEDVAENGTETAEWTHGFIAEEMHELGLTDFVVYEDDEQGTPRPESVNYMSMSVILHQAVKEQAQKLKDLESRIAALEGN